MLVYLRYSKKNKCLEAKIGDFDIDCVLDEET
jgi:hypothetical protein